MRSLRGLLGSAAALAATTVLFWPSAALAVPPPPCAPILPLEDVSAGMLGTGWTVAQGTEPETFDVEVLGIARNLVGPGRDIIIAEVSGALVDDVGVWAGMSGSPIYVDEDGDAVADDLIGALAYGFSLGPSNIAGLTPAEDMERILGYSSASFRQAALPAKVKLSRAATKMISRATRTPMPAVSGNLLRLKLPVSVSGVTRMGRVKKMLRRQHVAAIPHAGSSASLASVGSIDEFRPGDNFAAAFSYGDVTMAGVGTTTYVCDGQALAFGHPFLFGGRTILGASGAEAITVVDDPTLTPFKLANIDGVAGRVDQDRLAGIRASDGVPDTLPIDSAVTSLDTLNARTGHTDVVLESEYPFIAFAHLFSNIDTVFDEIGAGSSTVGFQVNGTRADGTPWQLNRTNMFTSDFDLSIDSSFELLLALDSIANNPYEQVEFTGVQVTASVQDTVQEYNLTDVLVCSRAGCFEDEEIFVRGRTLDIIATLTPSDGSEAEIVELSVEIPRRARFLELEVSGGGDSFCFEGECEAAEVDSFPALLRSLRRQPTGNVLTARLRSGLTGRVSDREDVVLDRVVHGTEFFFVGN